MAPSVKYMRVGRGFGIRTSGRKDYTGVIVASPDAFFLLPLMHMNLATLGAIGLGGAIGGAIAGALAHEANKRGQYLSETKNIIEMDLADLRAEITDDPDWPLKKAKGKVLVVPRRAITKIKYSFWGHFKLVTEEATFLLELSLFPRRRITRFLRSVGWKF